MRRKIIILFGVATLSLAVIVAWPHFSFYMLTGRLFPVEKIETLQNSVGVKRWSPDGLSLTDGRTLQLPGLRALPSQSAALTEVTKRGVEVGAKGRIYGLVRIHHWCGNDPVREHIAKVDIADMMTFLRVGQSTAPVPEPDYLVREAGGSFTEWGWRIEECLQFQSWQSMKSSAQ